LKSKIAAIVLAAGKGKRMKSDLPKVLHPIHGRPMIKILLDTLAQLQVDRTVVVVGHKGEEVQSALADYAVQIVWQREQLGTGHAVMMARELMADFDGSTLVVAGDVPLLSLASIRQLFEVHEGTKAVATCLSAVFTDPKGYGRIIRGSQPDQLLDIVEHKDASEEIRKIAEVNSGTFCFNNRALFGVIDKLGNDNAQREYYLTDVVKIFNRNGLRVSVTRATRPEEVLGVNSAEDIENLSARFPKP
jgi:bifunctional UDP-N-acetylglucosamine pyrophosphorylase/glucosamine-1-phosphate N-acetyltransferase